MLQNTGHAAAIGDKGFWSHTLISITHLTDSQHFDLQNIAAHLQPDCSPTARVVLRAASMLRVSQSDHVRMGTRSSLNRIPLKYSI